jgi:hypothetical protein
MTGCCLTRLCASSFLSEVKDGGGMSRCQGRFGIGKIIRKSRGDWKRRGDIEQDK